MLIIALVHRVQRLLVNQLIIQIILKHEGRIYLSKDSLMSEKFFKSTYRSWENFHKFRANIGADQVFNSIQSKRLGI
jgi:exosome complex RNA-binding protein Rrp4